MRERVAPDDRLVRLHRVAGEARDHAAGAGELARVEVVSTPCSSRRVRSSITISSSEQLPARSPIPLIAHSTWRAPPAARRRSWRPRARGRRGSGPRARPVAARGQLVEAGEVARVLLRGRVADRVGDVDHGRALGDRDRADLGGELDVGAGRVHRRELDVVGVGPGQRDGRLRLALDVLARGLQLVLDVDVGGRDEGVDPRSLRVLDRAPGGVDVSLVGAGEPADHRSLDLRAIASTASKSPGEVIGKPASITSTPSRASCWAISTFSCGVERDPRRLLAVAQRGVEDMDAARPCASRPCQASVPSFSETE